LVKIVFHKPNTRIDFRAGIAAGQGPQAFPAG
jgi:hypothetical protein